MQLHRKSLTLLARIGVVLFLFALVISVAPRAASAHAEIVSSNPAPETVLKSSPEELAISFSESVETNSRSLQLFDAKGKEISLSNVGHKTSSTVSAIPPKLSDGTYVMSYNIISADSHPIRGAQIFSVGTPLDRSVADNAQIGKILDGQKTPAEVKIAVNTSRFIVFASLAFVIAFLIFQLYIFAGKVQPKSIEYGFLYAAVTCVLATFIHIAFYTINSAQLSMNKVFDYSVYKTGLQTHFGTISLWRIGILIAMIVVWGNTRGKFQQISLGVLSVGLALTLGLSGHASAGKYVRIAEIMSGIHVLAASAWFGGLLILAVLLRKSQQNFMYQKFSKIAFVSVIAIAVSGAFAWWRQVGSIDATRYTWFGQLIAIKTISFILLIGIAYFSRRYVKKLGEEPSEIGSLKKCVRIEAALLIIVMVATSIVVGTIPGRDALARPVTKNVAVKQGYVEISVDPAKAGPVVIHIYALNKNGTPYQLSQQNLRNDNKISVTLTNKKRTIGPIEVPMRFQGLNHFVSTAAQIPFKGTWDITVRISIDEFNQIVASTSVNVR